MATINNINEDWGAPNCEWTGDEVQRWIKNNINNLAVSCSNLSKKDLELEEKLESRDCQILYMKSDKPCFVSYRVWPNIESQGYRPVGVAIMDAKYSSIIVGLEGYRCAYSKTQPEAHPSPSTLNRALIDVNGLANTATESRLNIYGDELEKQNYAVHKCLDYASSTSSLFVKRKWYLPALGELCVIHKYRNEINKCLAAISGAELICDGEYWSSSNYGGEMYETGENNNTSTNGEMWSTILGNESLTISTKKRCDNPLRPTMAIARPVTVLK